MDHRPRKMMLIIVVGGLVLAGLLSARWLLSPERQDYCGTLAHVPPLIGLTADEVRSRTGWKLAQAGGQDTMYVVHSRSGLGTGGGGVMKPLHERVGPLVLAFGDTGHVMRVTCADWSGP